MFERYTEKARRAVFFARYEASQYGSPVIDAEHVLLGILREDKRLSLMLGEGAAQTIRAQIDARTPRREPTATSVDLPLSPAAKQILKYASAEADRLKHSHIGCEHLFLGLLGEKDCLARQVLQPFGASIEQMRKKFEQEGAAEQAPGLDLGLRVRGKLRRENDLVKIREQYWDAAEIGKAVRRCSEHNWHWQKAAWKPRDLYVNRKTRKISLSASLDADTESFEFLKDGWKKDHCAMCGWELYESDDDHGVGYTNGRDWICTECYEKFWDRPNFTSGSYSDLT